MKITEAYDILKMRQVVLSNLKNGTVSLYRPGYKYPKCWIQLVSRKLMADVCHYSAGYFGMNSFQSNWMYRAGAGAVLSPKNILGRLNSSFVTYNGELIPINKIFPVQYRRILSLAIFQEQIKVDKKYPQRPKKK